MIGAAAAAAAAPLDPPNEVDPINKFFLAYESLNLKTYTFDYYLKSGSGKHVKIRLDVSGEQIAFELLEKTSKLTWKQMSLNTQRLVDCVLSSKEPNSRKGNENERSFDQISFVFLLKRSNTCFVDCRKSTRVRWGANFRHL